MDIVDIYGHINNGSQLLIGVGNYNNIHGLVAYFPLDDLLQIRSLSEIYIPSVIELTLNYEHISTEKICFSLQINGCNKYIGAKFEVIDEKLVACAMISSTKFIFWIDYSSIDKKPRSKIMAGGLYALKTIIDGLEYSVSWKIQGFSPGDLIIFLPTTWYENDNGICVEKSGATELINNLSLSSFKGYTSYNWCENIPNIKYCTDNDICGKCFGQCINLNHICFYGKNNKFICGPPNDEPNIDNIMQVSFANDEINNNLSTTSPTVTGTTATWIGLVILIILILLLFWAFYIKLT